MIKLPDFSAIGNNIEFLYGYILALIPLIWIKFTNRVANIFYMFIYITVIIPSMIFLINNKNIEFSSRTYFSGFILFSFFITHLITYLPPFRLQLSQSSKKILWILLLISTFGLSAYFLISNPGMLKNVQLFDVYEKRLEIREAIQTGSRSRINSYLANWLGTAIAPFLGVVGYRKKNVFLIVLALAAAYISFGISSQKTAFFSLIIALSFVVFALFIQGRSRKNVDISLIVAFVLIFGYSVAPFVVDWIWFQEAESDF